VKLAAPWAALVWAVALTAGAGAAVADVVWLTGPAGRVGGGADRPGSGAGQASIEFSVRSGAERAVRVARPAVACAAVAAALPGAGSVAGAGRELVLLAALAARAAREPDDAGLVRAREEDRLAVLRLMEMIRRENLKDEAWFDRFLGERARARRAGLAGIETWRPGGDELAWADGGDGAFRDDAGPELAELLGLRMETLVDPGRENLLVSTLLDLRVETLISMALGESGGPVLVPGPATAALGAFGVVMLMTGRRRR